PAQLGVGEGALAYLLLVRLLDPGDRREREHVARDQPIEKLRQRPERAICEITAAACDDVVDQINHITLADAADGTPTPCSQDHAVEYALGGPSGRGAGLAVGMKVEESGDRRLDLVVTPVRFERHTRYIRMRHDPLLEPVAPGCGLSARGGKRETAVTGAAERLFPGLALPAEPECPGARAARLHDQIETGAAGVGIFGARRLRPNRGNEAMGDGIPHDCIPSRGKRGKAEGEKDLVLPCHAVLLARRSKA